MSQLKNRLSQTRKEAYKLFSLEKILQRSVFVLNVFAVISVVYLISSSSKLETSNTGIYLVILISLSVFLIANLFQQQIVMRLRKDWLELEEKSTYDSVTKAFNRGAFEEILSEEMGRARRYSVPLSLCIIDLDDFKTFNDTYGHPQGDRLLKNFSERVRQAIRGTDCFARYGGDEFCILLPHTDLISAEKFVGRILLEIQEWLDSTFSAGVTTYKAPEDKSSFMTRADLALYQAKREGKNKVRCLVGDEDDSQVVVKF
jgi:diguanylate cyclase (GGDEF)-like protein